MTLTRSRPPSVRPSAGERVRSVAQAVALPALGLGLLLSVLLYGLLALLAVRVLLG